MKYEKMIFSGYELYMLRQYIPEWRRLDAERFRCREEQSKIRSKLFRLEVEEHKLKIAQRKIELELNRIISENKDFYSDSEFVEGKTNGKKKSSN